MESVAKAATGLAIVGFLAAVVTSFTGPIMGIMPETFSRASANLALIALCLFIGFKDDAAGG
jgi:hypothetical protein